ncbi:MAG: hypothetical protein NC218_11140 [Acetobacter sp.]|nr:hypothetical protein [Acetobacter sp.]
MMKKKELKLVEDVLAAVRCGCSLYTACVKVGISTQAFYDILAADEKAKVAYQLALSDYADQCMDDIRAIAAGLKSGEIDTSTAKLLIETHKWLAQKACPEPFTGMTEGNDVGNAGTEIVVKFV